MTDSKPDSKPNSKLSFAFTATQMESSQPAAIENFSDVELARFLAERLAIAESDWHRLKSNRSARALEQTAAALVYLLGDRPEEALPRLQQAIGWLDRSISAPPCPTHGDRRRRPSGKA